MTSKSSCVRMLVVIMQLLFISLPIFAEFNPTNPPEPNITKRLMVGVSPAEAGWAIGEGNYREGSNVYIETYSDRDDYKFLYWTINGYVYNYNTGFNYTMGDSAVVFIAHYEYVEPTPPPFEPGNPPEPYIKQYIQVELDPNQGGYTLGTGSYSTGEVVQIEAHLEPNYELHYWTINGYPWHETSHQFDYVVGDTNAHFVAHIVEKHLLTLRTKPRAAGTSTMAINGTPFITDRLVASGNVIDFHTSGNEDYTFRHWTINGYEKSTATSFQYTMGDSAASVVAVYDYIGHGDTTMFNPDSPPEPDLREDITIIVLSADESKGIVEGGGTYLYGTIDTLYAYPIEGFTFSYWHDGSTDNPRIIQATQDSVFIAHFGNDTVVWNDTICYGETLQIGDSILSNSGHYEFYTLRPDGYFTWNIVDLTVLHQMSSSLEATICAGETFFFEGVEYNESGTYQCVLKNALGCDSTVTLTLLVLPPIESTEQNVTICYGDTFVWDVNGQAYSASALDSIVLPSAQGCDSIIKLNLTVLADIPETIHTDTICEGDTYSWSVTGETYTTTTDTSAVLTSVNGCDSVVRLQLYVRPIIETKIDTTICFGERYEWEGQVYTTTTQLSTTHTNIYGCDSIATLHLTILPPVEKTVITDTICYGDSYTWPAGEKSYFTDAIDTIVLADRYGCDSMVILHLTQLPRIETSISQTICYGDTFVWEVNGQAYTTSIVDSVVVPSAQGCDSIIKLNLTVLADIQETIHTDTICEGDTYRWYVTGQTYTTTTDTSAVLTSVNGCDSVVRLQLYARPIIETKIDTTICYGERYEWEGQIYTTTTQHSTTHTNIYGCDSIATLHLTVLPPVENTIIRDTICYSDSYTWPAGEKTYFTDAIDTIVLADRNGCDSMVILQLTQLPKIETNISQTICYGDTFVWDVNGLAYSASALDSIVLPSAQGCDSIIKLNLTVLAEIPETIHTDTICEGDTYSWSITGETYTTTTDTSVVLTSVNGCDSVVRLQLYVRPIIETKTDTTICFGERYEWDGQIYTTTTQLSTTHTNIYGCDSIATLHLTVLPPVENTIIRDTICYGDSYTWPTGEKSYFTDAIDTLVLADRYGCDSMVILHLTQLPKIETSITQTICYGDTFVWDVNGQAYTTSIVDSVVVLSSQGCDSIIKLNLTVLADIPETIHTDTICEGDTYRWYVTGQTYNTTTDTSVVLTSVNGCDSVVRLQLYVRPIIETKIDTTICYGERYEWEGQLYTTTTHRSITHTNIYGCDSIATLHLTVLPPVEKTIIRDTICYGDSYTWPAGAKTYFTDAIDTLVLADRNGCDSMVILHLAVLPQAIIDSQSITICESDVPYLWYGQALTHTGTYTSSQPFTSFLCDSIQYVLNLMVVSTLISYDTVFTCDTYTWNGITYENSGDYVFTTTSSYGCDSIAMLHLTILNGVEETIVKDTICAGESFTWAENGKTYTTDVVESITRLSVYGCDSVVSLHLTVLPESPITEEYAAIREGDVYHWHGIAYTDAGDYTLTLVDSNGCDSVVVLHLQVVDTNFSVITYEQCADDPVIEFEMHNDASLNYFHIQWDEVAHAQNLQDTIVEVNNGYISIPNTARAGVYHADISAWLNNTDYATQSHTITLLYPSSVLDQHWDDFIGVLTYDYNGGYDFVSFQWYKDNEPIVGENKSYIATSLEMGASYSALLEDANGVKLMTCPIIATHQEELSLYPSMLRPRQTIHIHTTHYATILFYTLDGDLIYSSEQEAGEILLQAPERSGLYIVQVIYHNEANQVLTRKITVQ